MSGSILQLPRGRAPGLGLAGDSDVPPAVLALISVQDTAARALAEGAISEADYEALLTRADEIDAAIARDGDAPHEAAATDLAAEAESTRVSGGSSHRSRIWVAMLAAILASVLLVVGLSAWTYRGARR